MLVEDGIETPEESNEFEDLAGRLTEDEPEETLEDPETSEDSEGTDETSDEIQDDEPEDTEPEEEESDEEAQGFPKEQKDKDHEAFAKLRVEKTRYENIISNLAKKEGLTVEQYEEKLQQDEIEAEAKAAQVPVEMLQRMKDLEAAEVNRQKEFEAAQFRLNIERFQNKHDLDEPALKEFIDTCFENNIDLTRNSVDLEILYRGLNHDTIVETERQKWISKDQDNRTSGSNPGSGKGKTPKSKPGGEVSSPAELRSILDQINQ